MLVPCQGWLEITGASPQPHWAPLVQQGFKISYLGQFYFTQRGFGLPCLLASGERTERKKYARGGTEGDDDIEEPSEKRQRTETLSVVKGRGLNRVSWADLDEEG